MACARLAASATASLLLLFALLNAALQGAAATKGPKVTTAIFDDIPLYTAPSASYTEVQLDLEGNFTNPRKLDKMWGKEGWKVEPIVKTTAIGIAPDGLNSVGVRAGSTANSKFAPAKAIATAYAENGGNGTARAGDVWAEADGRATGKPAPVFGAIVTQTDATAVSGGDVLSAGRAAVLSSSRATGGMGVTIAKAYGRTESAQGAFSGIDMRSKSNKWYAAPGVALGGMQGLARGGHATVKTDGEVYADLGTAITGSLIVAKSNGVQQSWYDNPTTDGTDTVNGNNNIFTKVNNDATVDVGAAFAGSVNIGSSEYGKVVLLDDNTEADASVGDAAAAALSVAVSNQGAVLIGDYDIYTHTQNEVVAKTRGRGTAQGLMVNIGLAPNDDSEITGDIVVNADQGDALAGTLSFANGWGTASNDVSTTATTSEYNAAATLLALAQGQEQATNTAASSARSNIGSALSLTLSNAIVAEVDVATGSASATTVSGQAASASNSQAWGGVTTESQAASSATTKDGHALSEGTASSISAMTAESVSTSSATTTEGAALSASGALSAALDSEADSASSSATGGGNAASASGALALGGIQGKANSAASSATSIGSVGSIAVGAATGAIQALSKASSSSQTADGNAESLAGAYSFAGINSVASSKSTAASQTGDVDSVAEAFGIGGFHGEANADSAAATGCADCDSTSSAMAIATGFIADATARSKADSPKNPGLSTANAMAFGAVSRTNNGGQATVAVGPAQALTGGFAVSAPRLVVSEASRAAREAADPSKQLGGAAGPRRSRFFGELPQAGGGARLQ